MLDATNYFTAHCPHAIRHVGIVSVEHNADGTRTLHLSNDSEVRVKREFVGRHNPRHWQVIVVTPDGTEMVVDPATFAALFARPPQA